MAAKLYNQMNVNSNLTVENFSKLTTAKDKLVFLATVGGRGCSPHNSQGWFFTIAENELSVLPNFNRLLPAADPTKREFFISLGTVIENICMAADALGIDYTLTLHTNSRENFSAVFSFTSLTPSRKPDSDLLNNILNRHNNRSAYTPRALEDKFLNTLADYARAFKVSLTLVGEKAVKQQITQLMAEAVEQAFNDKKFTRELSYWAKPNFPWYEDGLPGYSMFIPYPLSLVLPWVLRYVNISQKQKHIHTIMLESAPVFAVLGVAEENVESWVVAGRAFQRMAVEAQGGGVGVGVMQAVVENARAKAQLQTALNTAAVPVLFFRLGYPSKIPKTSPRIDIQKLILNV